MKDSVHPCVFIRNCSFVGFLWSLSSVWKRFFIIIISNFFLFSSPPKVIFGKLMLYWLIPNKSAGVSWWFLSYSDGSGELPPPPRPSRRQEPPPGFASLRLLEAQTWVHAHLCGTWRPERSEISICRELQVSFGLTCSLFFVCLFFGVFFFSQRRHSELRHLWKFWRRTKPVFKRKRLTQTLQMFSRIITSVNG